MAIINSDDPRAGRIIEALTVPHLTYGIRNAQADYRAEKVQVTPGGVEYDLRAAGVVTHVKLGISGLFNVYNSLAALTTVCSLGVSLDEALKAVEDFQGVRGRFQMVRKGQQFAVVVDYAHTPDGLENILKAAREITSRSLITVFGCGGDRDRTKRPLMGKIAATLSDSVIITSDNPRTEDPGKILQDIEEGVRPVKSDYEKIVDRRDAIGRALHRAQPGDTVVVAGKGHENYQIFKDRTIHFDDVEVVEEQLGGLGY
jgi:UDP-N-acetylmuramyl-tripeptide synthetase